MCSDYNGMPREFALCRPASVVSPQNLPVIGAGRQTYHSSRRTEPDIFAPSLRLVSSTFQSDFSQRMWFETDPVCLRMRRQPRKRCPQKRSIRNVPTLGNGSLTCGTGHSASGRHFDQPQAALNGNIHTSRGASAYDRVQTTQPVSRLHSLTAQPPLHDHTILLIGFLHPNTCDSSWRVLKRAGGTRMTRHRCK